jgi:hypothetical protein
MRPMPYLDNNKRKENHKKYMREVWYPKNKQKHISYMGDLKKRASLFITQYKKNKKCIDCGFDGFNYPEVLEFDHLRDKEFDVSMHTKYTSSLERIQKEMEKCELVCANCHRIRTVNRKNKLSA